MVRLNRIYTKAGDGGQTRLVGGQKVAKDSLPADTSAPAVQAEAAPAPKAAKKAPAKKPAAKKAADEAAK